MGDAIAHRPRAQHADILDLIHCYLHSKAT